MKKEFTMSMYANKDDLIAAMSKRIEELEAQLVAEAARTAQEKLRADQMTKQHAMQAKMHAQTSEQLAVLQQGVDSVPMQQVVIDLHGIHRFKANTCVNALYEHGCSTGFGLNELAQQDHSAEDRMQLAQQLGYSVDGYCTLSYVTEDSYQRATTASEALAAKEKQV